MGLGVSPPLISSSSAEGALDRPPPPPPPPRGCSRGVKSGDDGMRMSPGGRARHELAFETNVS